MHEQEETFYAAAVESCCAFVPLLLRMYFFVVITCMLHEICIYEHFCINICWTRAIK